MVQFEMGISAFMKKRIIVATIIFSSCSPSETAKIVKNDHQKNNTQEIISITRDTLTAKKNTPKKLRYLFYANGGLIGYFDDGTIVGCPSCDLIDENVKMLYSMKPTGKYSVNQDGSLLVGEKEMEYPQKQQEANLTEWAMIDYKWIVQPTKTGESK